jgi:hypothetical protein
MENSINKDIKKVYKRGKSKVIKQREYNNARFRNLKYNQFQNIDFIDSYEREYKFNIFEKDKGAISYNRDLSDPPVELVDKYSNKKNDESLPMKYGKIFHFLK